MVANRRSRANEGSPLRSVLEQTLWTDPTEGHASVIYYLSMWCLERLQAESTLKTVLFLLVTVLMMNLKGHIGYGYSFHMTKGHSKRQGAVAV